MNQHQTLILVDIFFGICIAITLLTGFDFITFTVKSAPKSASLTKRHWRIGFLSFCAVIVIYIIYYKY